jgi:ubiquinone/menaquinone biosynthesis C-methylase UbiE/DNA-binding transcriptional ArsR family regulator
MTMKLSRTRAVEVLRAAGEPTRLRILSLLAHDELAVMELSQILNQSQPRVSRHLKLLTEAGLVERFPDGAWVFYRLPAADPGRSTAERLLGLVDDEDPAWLRDAEQLEAVRGARMADAADYFERNAQHWNEIRSLYVAEDQVEAAILNAAGPGPHRRLIDLGTGAGRMLALLGPKAQSAMGLDLSNQMLNVARRAMSEAGLAGVELRHGDIFATGLPSADADLVVIHRVLHYLADPAAAVAEAARLLAPGGRLLIVDFAPHGHEFLREEHQHRRLGFTDEEIARWLDAAGVAQDASLALPPATSGGLTVKIWTASRPKLPIRTAA